MGINSVNWAYKSDKDDMRKVINIIRTATEG